MQEHVLQWLGGNECPTFQQPLTIGHSIENFETDFSNGYLIGKILCQYGICESLKTFSNKTNKEAKVHNFYQIEEALRRIKIPFDAKMIHNVMQEEPGAAMRLLYIMKKGFDSHFSQSDVTVTGLKQKALDKHVKQVKELELKLPQIHREFGISGPTFKSQKLLLVEEKLLKFELAKANLFKKVVQDEKAERTMLMSMQQQKRQDALKKMTENQTFMKEWHEEGTKNWQKNQDKREFEISRTKYFEDREIKIFRDTLNKELNYNTKDMQGGIYEFHENLRKLGVEENITIQEAIERQEKKKGIPPGQIQNFSYAATMNKIKETKNQNEFAGKERERRQRKLKVDQIKIQEMLDSEKREELILQKLLAKQTEEQKQSYINWRNEKCKEIVTKNKVEKAEAFSQERLEMTAKIEKQLRQQAESGEAERQNAHLVNKNHIKIVRKEEKLKRRRVNVEIASEIIDLIMDVADEAFDYQLNHQHEDDEDARDIKKEVWRDWMDIFSAGKKVSEANIVIQQDEVLEKSDSDKNPISKMLGLGVESMTASQVLERVKNEQAFIDLQQYISVSGPINMHLFAQPQWQHFFTIIENDPVLKSKHLDLTFLHNSTIPSNQELGQLISELYSIFEFQMSEVAKSLFIQNTTSMLHGGGASTFTIHKTQSQLAQSKMETIAEDEPTERSNQNTIPLWHTLKLCLIGKAYAGKKTMASLIKEEFGESITIFHMEDILREALNYVSTDKKEEVPDPKAKGKKPQEVTQSDSFAGQNTTEYKLIASELMKNLQLQTGKDKIPGKDVNLISLIKNDQMLVRLFIEKLKLTFHQNPPSSAEQETKMRENLAKEEELRVQLVEALENETTSGDLQNAAKGGKAPPKGVKGTAKSSKEIKDEIDQLLAIERNGWVLLDFPKTINQAKLLEGFITGYKSPTDLPKSGTQANKEVWTNFADPEEEEDKPEFLAQPSFFDSIILLDASKEECLRRGLHRKIDPTSNTVFHMEDNPPPANDQKLLDRLQDNFGNQTSEHDLIAFLDQSHIEFSDNQDFLRKFYAEFGALDQEAGIGIESFEQVSIREKIEKDKVYGKIHDKIQSILRFKQVQKDRDYQALRYKIQAEKEGKITEQDQQNLPPESSQMQTIEKEGDNNQPHRSSPAGGDDKNNTNGRMSEGKSDIQSKRSYSRSISQAGGMKRASKKKEYTREYKLQIWDEMTLTYIREGIMNINQIKKQSEAVIEFLNLSQSDFVSFLQREDSKQAIVNEFINSYNMFCQEYPDLRQDDQTKDELISRVQQLSSALWTKIEQKKEENLNEIKRQAEDGWSAVEMKHVCKCMAKLIEIEIKKFNTVYQIVIEQDPPVELDAEIMVKKMIERGVKPYDSTTQSSPIFSAVVVKLVQGLEDLQTQANKEFNFAQNHNALVLEQEKNIFMYRLALIQAWALCCLEEISVNSSDVYALMDDWIVEAVSLENNQVEVVLEKITEFIRSNDLIMNEQDFQLQPIELYQHIEMRIFEVDQQPLYLQRFHAPDFRVEDQRFDTADLKHLFQQCKRTVGVRGSFDLMDEQSFISIMMLTFRQGRIPFGWRFLNFEKVHRMARSFRKTALPNLVTGNDEPSEYQSKLNSTATKSFQADQSRQWVDWKAILLHLILFNSPLPSPEEIERYETELMAKAVEKDHISCEQFVLVPAWFDKTEGRADTSLTAEWLEEAYRKSQMSVYEDEEVSEEQIYSRLDESRLMSVKELVFDVMRDKIGQNNLKISDLVSVLRDLAKQNSGGLFSSVLVD